MKDLSISDLARLCKKDWKKPYFGAIPYLEALCSIDTFQDTYGQDSAESIVLYFLSKASTWRGPVAREVKAELNRRIKFAKSHKFNQGY